MVQKPSPTFSDVNITSRAMVYHTCGFLLTISSWRIIIITIHAYSHFPEAEIVNSTAAKGTISKLDQIFAIHGILIVLVSDNGFQFFGDGFKHNMKKNGNLTVRFLHYGHNPIQKLKAS